ncbi:MAG: hypothetical protein RIC52_10060 [Amphiplicatus sp.]
MPKACSPKPEPTRPKRKRARKRAASAGGPAELRRRALAMFDMEEVRKEARYVMFHNDPSAHDGPPADPGKKLAFEVLGSAHADRLMRRHVKKLMAETYRLDGLRGVSWRHF